LYALGGGTPAIVGAIPAPPAGGDQPIAAARIEPRRYRVAQRLAVAAPRT